MEELAEAKAKASMLQAEVDRLKAVEAQQLFADASRMAIELAALKEENTRLQAQADDAKAQVRKEGTKQGTKQETNKRTNRTC